MSGPTYWREVSSANSRVIFPRLSVISLIYSKDNKGQGLIPVAPQLKLQTVFVSATESGSSAGYTSGG